MPTAQTMKREAYCYAAARGISGTQAAFEAGFAHPAVASSKLLKIPEVRGRIAELRGKFDEQKFKDASRFIEPTRAWVMSELCENVGKAKEANDRGAVNKGLELVGRELGMFVVRSMAIESPLQRLPADKLLQLLALVEEATGLEQVAKPAAPRPPEPVMIEGELVTENSEDW